MSSLISILIPAYNAERWIAETIRSALAQSWPNKEIIVINDGSQDNTLSIAKKFESPIVKIIDQEHKGASAAENHAFRASQGGFIEYLDADDLLAPDKIERQMKLFEKIGPGYVISGEWARFSKLTDKAKFIPQPLWHDMSPVDWLILCWETNSMMHGAAWLIPRKMVEEAGPWNENLSLINDFEYFPRILLRSKEVIFCERARTYYRSDNINRLSAAKSVAAIESAFRSLELGTGYLLEKENSPRTRHACATTFQRFIYDLYPDVPKRLIEKAQEKVRIFGGAEIKPFGGPALQSLSRIFGWKFAKYIQKYAYKYGYKEIVAVRRHDKIR